MADWGNDAVVMRSVFIPNALDRRLAALSFKKRMASADLILELLERGLDAVGVEGAVDAPGSRCETADESRGGQAAQRR